MSQIVVNPDNLYVAVKETKGYELLAVQLYNGMKAVCAWPSESEARQYILRWQLSSYYPKGISILDLNSYCRGNTISRLALNPSNNKRPINT